MYICSDVKKKKNEDVKSDASNANRSISFT